MTTTCVPKPGLHAASAVGTIAPHPSGATAGDQWAIQLAAPTDLAGFRRASRSLFQRGVAPDRLSWHVAGCRTGDGTGDITGGLWEHNLQDHPANSFAAEPMAAAPADRPGLQVPRAFLKLCEEVILHRDPSRFDLLYRLLWRLAHEPTLRHDPLDADMMRAQGMARAVRRDIHKMRAFVRFRPVAQDRHVAWFEPAHHIVEANAPFFMRRFAQMRWAILTPERCVEWDGERLHFQPGADHHDAPGPDAGEALWLTYYEHIFNPTRLKLATMAREMPRRYWSNLPEAALIQALTDSAEDRSQAMVAAAPTTPSRAYRPIAMPRRAHLNQTNAEDAANAADRSSAHAFKNLSQLADAMQACRDCPIGAGATQAVCGEGPMQAAHMIVGEQPGDQEDLAGHPFVGPAGRLLSKAMLELGWPRESVFITNAVKHFKYELRGKRRMHKTPGQREVEICSQWLDREIEMVRPATLVALGATAARALLSRPVAITREHGQWLHERADGIPVLVTWHPSALLRIRDDTQDETYALWQSDLKKALEGHRS